MLGLETGCNYVVILFDVDKERNRYVFISFGAVKGLGAIDDFKKNGLELYVFGKLMAVEDVPLRLL